VTAGGCWVHAEPDVPVVEERHEVRREVVVHPEDSDGHDDEHHRHHDHDHDHDDHR
jgi:hypothetical protein